MEEAYNNVDSYIKHIKILGNGLGPEREKRLSRIIKCSRNINNKNKAVDDLVNGNLGLVVKCAMEIFNRYHSSLSMMDLITEGNLGLFYSARNFSYRKDCRFSTYAYPIIRWHIMMAINTNTLIHIPLNILDYRKKIRELQDKYNGKLTTRILMKELRVLRSKAEAIMDALVLRMSSLDCEIGEKGSTAIKDMIEDKSVPNPSLEADKMYLKIFLDNACKECLNERERKIIDLVFYTDNPTIDIISNKIGVTRERIRQIYASSLRKIKKYFFDKWMTDHGEKIYHGDPKFFHSRRKKDRYTRKVCERYNVDAKSKQIFESLTGQ